MKIPTKYLSERLYVTLNQLGCITPGDELDLELLTTLPHTVFEKTPYGNLLMRELKPILRQHRLRLKTSPISHYSSYRTLAALHYSGKTHDEWRLLPDSTKMAYLNIVDQEAFLI